MLFELKLKIIANTAFTTTSEMSLLEANTLSVKLTREPTGRRFNTDGSVPQIPIITKLICLTAAADPPVPHCRQ